MIGAIIGDTIGSIYEFDNIKTKVFDFWGEGIEPTDDSVLTFATANWLLHGGKAWQHYCDFATEYDNPMGEYGSGFLQFVANARRGGKPQPYNSCGNGSAMRVGPVGWAFDTMDEVLEWAKVSAECSHNHPEGIKGAQATAASVLLARKGTDKAAIKKFVEGEFGYDLDFTLDELRPIYGWDFYGASQCQGTVPQAIRCVLEATDFEDAIRNAVSLGGDSDTLACIAGSIAEPLFGIPQAMYKHEVNILKALFPKLQKLLIEFEKKYGNRVI